MAVTDSTVGGVSMAIIASSLVPDSRVTADEKGAGCFWKRSQPPLQSFGTCTISE